MQADYEKISEDLNTHGYVICPHFISEAVLEDLRNDLQIRFEEGEFHKAGIGKGEAHQIKQEIRGDWVSWWDIPNLNPIQKEIYEEIEALKIAFNRRLFLGINYLEMHYAVYPSGKFYQKHLDSFQGSNRRKISFVLYLNQDWQTEQGGQLRLYLEDDQIKDVNPEGGTLVCFVSSELYHEVLITTQTRYSLTGWMRHDRLEDMLLNY